MALRSETPLSGGEPALGGGRIGHGGAYSTNSVYDTKRQLIMIFLVQHAGWPNAEGQKILPTFQRVAIQAFAPEPR